uniref:Uncharacterized protein n=1 Tax=Kalmanozyma brasiliensis (strain GHG001) TaxID=1365824 RepID=V5EZT3_KALBG
MAGAAHYPGTLSSISPSTSPYYSSSHPSPVPSTTSSAGGSSVSGGSSLRTPPDLLVNGASVGHTGKGLQQLAVNSWNAYRSAARELKHAADARASSLSASRPSYLAARPTQVSALEQLDAVLLFCYAFWLDDLAASCPGGGCIAKNWISLFGLLRYATNAHSDLGNDVLLGVCRLVESAVLRKLHAHDSAVLLKTLTANTGVSMGEVTQMVQRQTADLERSDRLAAQARNLLSLSNLAASHPELLAKALGSTVVNSEAAAKSVDPGSEESCGGLAWPLDSMSAMPFLVAFGRCAVAEQARRAGVEFALKVVERE